MEDKNNKNKEEREREHEGEQEQEQEEEQADNKNNSAEQNNGKELDLMEELKKCQELAEDYLNGWRRTKADLINYKSGEIERIKRAEEKMEEKWALKMVETLDNLARARAAIPVQKSSWARGMLQIVKHFQDALSQEGVEEIKAEAFNPEYHEVLGQMEDKKKKSGQITEVVQKGYKIKGRLLRPAKVKIVK